MLIDDGNVHVSYFRPLEENVDFTPDEDTNTTSANLKLLEELEEMEVFTTDRSSRKLIL